MKTCLTSIVMVLGAVVANAREPNYDESKVAPYTLEDPLTFADGLSCRAASPVWEFLGKEGLPKGDFPDNYDLSCVGSSFGYVRRGGQHGLAGYDWLWMLDFADKALRK